MPLEASGQQTVNLSCTMMSTITVELMDGEPVNRDGGGLSPQIAAHIYTFCGFPQSLSDIVMTDIAANVPR